MFEMNPSLFEKIASLCFALALGHTFSVKQFQKKALEYPAGSLGENFFHLLGEVEVVFGLWAGVFIALSLVFFDRNQTLEYLNHCQFTEPLFVFVIMVVCSTKPVLEMVEVVVLKLAYWIFKITKVHSSYSIYFVSLVVGPLLGSLITEPAAMTVTALFLLKFLFQQKISVKAKYLTLGLLFVNVSIGGVLTPYAAPPVLMVAAKWNWDLYFMLTHFAWRALGAMIVSTVIVTLLLKKDLVKIHAEHLFRNKTTVPSWIMMAHLGALFLIVLTHLSPVIFVGLFLFFLGLVKVTMEYQKNLKLKESLLVGFFLAGLVVLGGPQKWWLQPLISSLNSYSLYFGAAVLTAFTDNAALTYLGSQVENLQDISKFALVAGSVVGGGLTVIANAPNPAGYSILNSEFGEQGISPMQLFLGALLPTVVSAIFFFP